MKQTYLVLVSLFLMVVLISLSCQHEIQFPKTTGTPVDTSTTSNPPPPPPPPPPATGNGCSADTVYFVNTILPLITSNCTMSGCHGGSQSPNLTTYNGIKGQTKAGNAASSKLYTIISSGSMPPRGHTAITAAQLAEIQTWINQGSLNDSCTSTTCDTTNVTYSATIAPILQTYCTGCHSGSAPSGAGIDLSTYTNLLVQVKNGKFWGDVSHASGYNAMPLGGSILSPCDLNQIYSWINKGALNN